jgi:hypothetical protein
LRLKIVVLLVRLQLHAYRVDRLMVRH